MKLKTLSGKPANFPLSVTVKELDGSDVEVDFTGIGRTTLDWQPIQLARLEKDINAIIDAEEKQDAEKAKADEATDDADKPKKRKRIAIPRKEIEKSTEEGLAAGVSMVREVAQDWGLDLPFTDENIRMLIVQYPGIQAKVWQEYDARIKGNRAKN